MTDSRGMNNTNVVFGCVFSGRLPQFQTLNTESSRKALFKIADIKNKAKNNDHLTSSINSCNKPHHICLFITDSIPLFMMSSPNIAAAIYVGWSYSPEQVPVDFKYIGYIHNEKPSSVFKISPFSSAEATPEIVLADDSMIDINDEMSQCSYCDLYVGISIEDVSLNENNNKAAVSLKEATSFKDISSILVSSVSKIAENCVNYLSSFPGCPQGVLKAVNEWKSSLQKKAQLDPKGFTRSFITNEL